MDTYEIIKKYLKVNDILDNPRRGTSIILNIDEEKIRFQRGSSPITYRIEDIGSAFEHFKGKKVSTSDLRKFDARVYDNKPCRATFFLMLMCRCQLTKNGIKGNGCPGNPFYVELKEKNN